MTPPLCFIDTETTGLDPERHEIWEVAVSIRKQWAQKEAALARQYVQHEIYIGGADDDLAMVFMPIALTDISASWDIEKIGLVFEEISKAGPRSINGRPCFFSCQFLHIDDLKPFTAEVKRMCEALGIPSEG